MFTETPPASGDKGPDNPSTISGVSNINITRCGKNLMPVNMAREAVDWGVERHGIIANKISDAVVSLTGKATQDTGVNLLPRIHLPNGLTYTLSGADSDARINNVDNYWLVIWQSGSINAPYDRGNGSTFLKIRYDSYDMLPSICIKKDWEFNNKILKIQIELGNQKTEFESPISNTYTIQLNDTYYGGTLDVASGVMTVTFASIVIDGTTTYSSSAGVTEGTNFYRLGLYPSIARKNSAIALYSACNTLPINAGDNLIRLANNSYKIEVQLQKSLLNLGDGESLSVVQSAFQTFFSAHPTTVVYPVSTPTTVQLSPTEILSLTQPDKYTPRLNTIYTDAQAVQVGYVKSPIREEFELQQAIVSQGGNI